MIRVGRGGAGVKPGAGRTRVGGRYGASKDSAAAFELPFNPEVWGAPVKPFTGDMDDYAKLVLDRIPDDALKEEIDTYLQRRLSNG